MTGPWTQHAVLASGFTEAMTGVGTGALWVGVWLLCVAGLVVSAVGISGTWLVLGASALAAALRPDAFPGILTLIVFLLVSVGVEGLEAVASGWGVKRRGGSNLAGFAAVVGGFAGLLLGAPIPIPVAGPLIGMCLGSFCFAFAVEGLRLRQSGRAAHIAWGTVVARMLVILLKVLVTMGMILTLALGICCF